MRSLLFLSLVTLGAPALAQTVPAPRQAVLVPKDGEVAAEPQKPKKALLPEVPLINREMRVQQKNRDTVGRKNATRDEQRTAVSPSWQSPALSNF
jgi:hypothetical protein